MSGRKISNLLIAKILICALLISNLAFTSCFSAKENKEVVEDNAEEDKNPESSGKKDDMNTNKVMKITDKEIVGDINILSGLKISDGISNSRPLAIMVENSPGSRPQSGLIYADIVFEVVDEGGITRYVAIFSSHDAKIVGPVRSARIYYAEIARSFDPVYVFFGTYPEAFEIIENMDLDVLSTISDPTGNSSIIASASYWRDWNRSSVQEHTAFMSTLDLKADAKRVGYLTNRGYSPLKFKLDALDSERGDISKITINFSIEQYRVDFDYDRATNRYLKYTAGLPHTDYESGRQIAVNNIIAIVTEIHGPIDEAGHMAVTTIGKGNAYYFLDGNVIQGYWERDSVTSPFTFKDSSGKLTLFNRGQTWIAIVSGIDRLTY